MSIERFEAEDDHGPTAIDQPKRWVVWRQDDNGNQFEVARKAARADAEELAAVLEARGHKQVYWVAKAPG